MNLEAAIVANCLGNLLSALILLLGYLLFQLWRDYIAIICSPSCSRKRSLASHTRWCERSRRRGGPPRRRCSASSPASPQRRRGKASPRVPPLMLLAGLLLLLLLDDISSVGVILAGLAAYGVVATRAALAARQAAARLRGRRLRRVARRDGRAAAAHA